MCVLLSMKGKTGIITYIWVKRADLHTALKSNVPVSMQLSAVLLLKELVYCILQVHLMKEK